MYSVAFFTIKFLRFGMIVNTSSDEWITGWGIPQTALTMEQSLLSLMTLTVVSFLRKINMF